MIAVGGVYTQGDRRVSLINEAVYRLGLDADTRKELEMLLCRRVCSAVEGSQQRNDSIQQWRDQLEGLGVTAGNKQWQGACDLPDPISIEAFLTILSQMIGASHRDPKVSVEAFSKEDEDNARVLEAWLSREGSRADIDARIYDFAYDASWAPYAVGYVGWATRERKERGVGYRPKGSANVLSEEDVDDGEQYEEVPISEVKVEERYDIRSIDPTDFFYWPPTAPTIERATLVAERMMMTAEELYDGIEDYGFDAEAVEQLCNMTPQGADEYEEARNDQDGEGDAGVDGMYEVFTCYTRLPRRMPIGEIPEYLLQDDFLVVCAPQQSIVLKMAFSPFKLERPYFAGGLLPKPRRNMGHSLMGLLEPLQSEANANVQYTIDCMNISMSPVLIGPESEKDNVAKAVIKPGGFIGETTPNSIRPLLLDKSALAMGLELQQDLRSRSKAIVSAEGQGELQNKVRKNEEIRNLTSQSSAKFGLYLSNFQRTVVAEVYRRLVNLKLQFGNVDDQDGEEFVDLAGHQQTLTLRALKGRYSITAVGTSLTHSPEARVEIGKQKSAVQTEYLMAKMKLPPDTAKYAWHAARELLYDLGERNPEAWIGEEPQEAPPAPQGPQNAPQGQQQPFQPGAAGNGNGAANPLQSLGAQ